MDRRRESNEFQSAEGFETGSGEGGEFAEEDAIDLGEVKAGLALHALAKFRRDALLQIWTHVDRHKVVAHVVLAQADGAEVKRFTLVARQDCFQIVEFRPVADDAEAFFIGGQDFLQRGEDGGEIPCGSRWRRFSS